MTNLYNHIAYLYMSAMTLLFSIYCKSKQMKQYLSCICLYSCKRNLKVRKRENLNVQESIKSINMLKLLKKELTSKNKIIYLEVTKLLSTYLINYKFTMTLSTNTLRNVRQDTK